ncbi:MAG: 2-amino-4-hydroxy-6-hydroxymethyldihydropteridine diphosphokinase [Gammaproteobacteria bacterium]|nr:2-amino-4-hydroxy-6-hydroxymethyldihydropteridine diphosphokinase [Gammaproteobacteria bacterium]
MATIYLGLGSNVDPEKNLSRAVQELRRHYGDLDASAVYRSAAAGFEGDDFLNLVVRVQSEESAAEVAEEIERLHDLSGRVRGGDKWVARPLDIDLLLYDDQVIDEPKIRVPRSDVLEYSFVLRPLAELAPELLHPLTGKTMLEHWQEFDAAAHPLELVGIVL